MGCAHRREDRPSHRVRARARDAGVLVGRLGRRAPHRPGRAVPGPARRGPHLLQPEPPLRSRAADLLPLRPVGGRRRVHPRVLRRRLHGRGKRFDVPRLATHGRDGGRGAHDVGGDGRCPHARDRLRERRQPRGRRRGRDRAGAHVLRVHARQLAVAASAVCRGSPGERVDGRRRPGERAHRLRHARSDRRSRRRATASSRSSRCSHRK